MIDTELLQALGQVVQDAIKPLEARIDSMEKSTNARFDAIDIRMDSMDTRMDSMETSILKTQMTIEGEISDKLNALADGFAGLSERNPKIDRMGSDIVDIKGDVSVIKAVVTSHSEDINDLRIAK